MIVVHLERKFTSTTETFIVNQINTLKKFNHSVFTIKHINNLKADASIYSPQGKKRECDFRLLNNKHIKFYKAQTGLLEASLIHSHFLTDARFFHPLTKKYSIPKICSCYGYDVSKFPKKYGILARLYFKKIFKEYNIFLAMTEDMKKDLINLGCPEEKVKVHYYGTDTSLFDVERDYTNKDKFTLLTIGSLVPKKGHLTILRALKELKDRFPVLDIEYNVIGNGILEKRLKEFVKENMLDDIVNFKGALSHGEKFNEELRKAHVFVHPSITTKEGDKEGIPGTIVEAMASGLPVISTIHAGIPYVIQDGVTGLLISEKDSNELADKIMLLYHDELLRRNLGQNAKEYATQKLDIQMKSKDLEAIYNSLIGIN
jgi:colanic acid/amylovoran biosynthesis glycosyltransferase